MWRYRREDMIYPNKKLEPIVRNEEIVAKCKEAATMDQAMVILEITQPKVKKLIRSARVSLVEQIGTIGEMITFKPGRTNGKNILF